jgi:hypothetical protein
MMKLGQPLNYLVRIDEKIFVLFSLAIYTLSTFVQLNEFFECVQRTGHSEREREKREGEKWVGEEIDAMTDNILSTLFSLPGKRVRWKEITKSERERSLRISALFSYAL